MHTRHTIALILAPALTVATLSSMTTSAYASSAYKVTVKMSNTKIGLGGKITAYGTVSPKAPGKTVKVYVHYGSDSSGEYHYVGSDTLNSQSKFVKKFEPTDSGKTTVKVVKAKSSAHKAGSKTASFNNYGYIRLSKLARTVERGVVAYSSAYHFPGDSEGNEGYGFVGASGAQARWDTHYQCTSFRALGAIEDSSASGTSAIANFVGEKGDESTLTIYEGSLLADGQEDPEPISLALTKSVNGVTQTARYIDISTQAYAGNPTYIAAKTQVHCNLPGGQIEAFYDE
ncbi:MAG: hypothetical protein JWQ70_3107 [Aeromicrobium sp.]|nr:hypothetical protein [Aeromicrobium sp.]